MIVTNGRITCDISLELLKYCPYIEGVTGFNLEQDINVDTVELIDDQGNMCTDDQFIALTSFLQGNNFKMDWEIYPFFEFMGFPNDGFSLDFYSVRLRDRWIRDHMYSEGLVNIHNYGLTEITQQLQEELELNIREEQVERLNILCAIDPKIVVAGGSTLCALGIIDRTSDYDLFIVGNEGQSVLNRLKEISDRTYNSLFNPGDIMITSVTERCTEFLLGMGEGSSGSTISMRCQVIHRLYRSRSEIIHGFDLDCCGVLYYNNKFYCTERALHSLRNRCNVVDYARSSASYSHRLLKYANRGFRIVCPWISHHNIDNNYIRGIAEDVCKDMLDIGGEYDTLRGRSGLASAYAGKDQGSLFSIWEYPARDQSMEDMLRIINNHNVKAYGYGEVVTMIYHRLMYLSGDIKRFSLKKATRRRVYESILHLLRTFTKGEQIWTGFTGRDVLSSDIEFIGRVARFLNVRGTEHQGLDSMSRVLISAILGITLYHESGAVSDYNSIRHDTELQDIPILIKQVVFNSQNPMTQVTSTWDPDHITSFDELYSTAEVYTPEPRGNNQYTQHTSERFNVLVSAGKFIATECRGDLNEEIYSDYKVIRNVPLDQSIRPLFNIVSASEFYQKMTYREDPLPFILIQPGDPEVNTSTFMNMSLVNRIISGRKMRLLTEAGHRYSRTCDGEVDTPSHPSMTKFICEEILYNARYRYDNITGWNIERLSRMITCPEVIAELERERDERIRSTPVRTVRLPQILQPITPRVSSILTPQYNTIIMGSIPFQIPRLSPRARDDDDIRRSRSPSF